MVTSFAEAVEALYRAPLDAFVAERKRLATELKANADKPGAARLVKLARPPISTWVVNQLWWHARDVFDELFASAARLRAGDPRATPAHREAIAALRTRATAILTAAGHAATDATLRRVTTNLSALAAAGGFAPDFAGALAMDREAPGFEAAGLALSSGLASVDPEQRVTSLPHPEPANQNQLARAEPHPESLSEPKPDVERQRAVQAERRRIEEAELRVEEAERLRVAEEKEEAERLRFAEAERQRVAREARLQAEAERQRQEARRRAERQQVQERARSLNGERESRQRETERLRQALEQAEQELERVHSRLAELDAQLVELDRVILSGV